MKEICHFFQMKEENIDRNKEKPIHIIRIFLLLFIHHFKDDIFPNTYSFTGLQKCHKDKEKQANISAGATTIKIHFFK